MRPASSIRAKIAGHSRSYRGPYRASTHLIIAEYIVMYSIAPRLRPKCQRESAMVSVNPGQTKTWKMLAIQRSHRVQTLGKHQAHICHIRNTNGLLHHVPEREKKERNAEAVPTRPAGFIDSSATLQEPRQYSQELLVDIFETYSVCDAQVAVLAEEFDVPTASWFLVPEELQHAAYLASNTR